MNKPRPQTVRKRLWQPPVAAPDPVRATTLRIRGLLASLKPPTHTKDNK